MMVLQLAVLHKQEQGSSSPAIIGELPSQTREIRADIISFQPAFLLSVLSFKLWQGETDFRYRIMEFPHQVLLCVAVYKVVINNFGNEGVAVLIVP